MASVVIAGAGLAGLSAAHELAKGGAAVTLLDARDHAGGRVRAIRDFAADQHAEAGGNSGVFWDGAEEQGTDAETGQRTAPASF